jgi:SAM-dependent methyltransferase
MLTLDTTPNFPQAWFETAVGQRFLADELRIVAEVLDTVFGEYLVQVGSWGAPHALLAQARTQHKLLVDWREGSEPDLVTEPTRLAIASDSVDAVLLPHTLERTRLPHALLREAGRILRADGHLIVLSFAPDGFWGVRHLLSPAGYPRGQRRMIRERRLRDWLELLSFAVGPAVRFCHTLPIARSARYGHWPEEAWASRWLPFLRGGYCLAAQKRVQPLTPVRPLWRTPRLRVVGSLVEPTTRQSQTRESS